jgi:hypothetical protein
MSDCHYCKEPEKYGLLSAEPCVFGQDAQGAKYWTSKDILELCGKTHMGHKLKDPSLSYPNYNILCKKEKVNPDESC